jgi:hypothetical protein
VGTKNCCLRKQGAAVFARNNYDLTYNFFGPFFVFVMVAT